MQIICFCFVCRTDRLLQKKSTTFARLIIKFNSYFSLFFIFCFSLSSKNKTNFPHIEKKAWSYGVFRIFSLEQTGTSISETIIIIFFIIFSGEIKGPPKNGDWLLLQGFFILSLCSTIEFHNKNYISP